MNNRVQPEHENSDGSQALQQYEKCAAEFHQTGQINEEAIQKDSSATYTCRMSLLPVMLVLCASIATGLVPLILLSSTLHQEVDGLATKFAIRVSDLILQRLEDLTEPGPRMCDNVHNVFRCGVLSSHLEAGVDSPAARQAYRFLHYTLHDMESSPVTWLYMGTEYDAFLGYLTSTTSSSPLRPFPLDGGWSAGAFVHGLGFRLHVSRIVVWIQSSELRK